jgi:hypothetical protein
MAAAAIVLRRYVLRVRVGFGASCVARSPGVHEALYVLGAEATPRAAQPTDRCARCAEHVGERSVVDNGRC